MVRSRLIFDRSNITMRKSTRSDAHETYVQEFRKEIDEADEANNNDLEFSIEHEDSLEIKNWRHHLTNNKF